MSIAASERRLDFQRTDLTRRIEGPLHEMQASRGQQQNIQPNSSHSTPHYVSAKKSSRCKRKNAWHNLLRNLTPADIMSFSGDGGQFAEVNFLVLVQAAKPLAKCLAAVVCRFSSQT